MFAYTRVKLGCKSIIIRKKGHFLLTNPHEKCCVKFLKREKEQEQEQEKVVETSPLKKDTTYTVENMFGIDASQITDTSMITEADLQGKGNQIKTEKYLASPKPTDDIQDPLI